MRPDAIANSLIVSCQPVPGGAMDDAASVIGFARAALDAGAGGLRIESVAYVAAVRAAVAAPIIGLVKRDLDDSPVRITPFLTDAEELADAGADIIAFDATARPRPAAVCELIAAIHARGRLAMADCSCRADAEAALAAGADIVGSTMSGYTGGPEPVEPDLALVASLRQLTPHVVAEGRLRTPEHAADAVRAGAAAVVVGSAITRPEHVTGWFRDAVGTAFARRDLPVLALDIGGTKTFAALVRGAEVIEEAIIATDRAAGPDAWLDAAADVARGWGGFAAVGAAVTGFVRDGLWSALNPRVLGIPPRFPLAERGGARFGAPFLAVNDAQAATWGEHRFGVGEGGDLVFLTISTGIGGGIVTGGRLLGGLAGHFGQLRSPSGGAAPLEDGASGGWMAEEAARVGHVVEAPAIFARSGEAWAEGIVATSAARVALLCRDIQLALDPPLIAIGGGVGLADGYLARIEARLGGLPPELAPRLAAARLGARAGILGVADLARSNA
ncbi:MAG: putative N-acetylmannosamine-6-phosphate 2-epimerase [Amaricoccus sp.]|uniref:putative N-acetylmannosamine-6-phosphate 2-epimerase n=1 Tax=Amaricoccus sp. TaxID=1872485 RepID=UPI0039E3958F